MIYHYASSTQVTYSAGSGLAQAALIQNHVYTKSDASRLLIRYFEQFNPAAPQSRTYRRYLAHIRYSRLISIHSVSVHRCVWVCQHCVSITPAECFGLGFLWNVISRVWERPGNPLREQRDGFEFGSCDKGNPRIPKCRIISERTLSRASRSRLFRGRILLPPPPAPSCRSHERIQVISVSRMVPNGRSSRLRLFWSYATGQLLSCQQIARRDTYTGLAWQAQNRRII